MTPIANPRPLRLVLMWDARPPRWVVLTLAVLAGLADVVQLLDLVPGL